MHGASIESSINLNISTQAVLAYQVLGQHTPSIHGVGVRISAPYTSAVLGITR